MRTLAIDQSFTHCAYVIADNDKVITFGVLTTDKERNHHERAFTLAGKLVELIMLNQIERVVLEDLAFGSAGNVAKSLAGLLYVLVHTCLMYNAMYELNIGLDLVSPTSLKKFATGSGKADKAGVVEATPKDVVKMFTDAQYKKTTGLTDLCDAYWLSQYTK